MKIRWQIILAVTLLIILVFFLTTTVLATLKVDKPLVSVLESESNISEFVIEEVGGKTQITVTLESFESLLVFHKELNSSIGDILNKDYVLVYDNEIPPETDINWGKYWRVNSVLQELLVSGNYAEAMNIFDDLLGKDSYFIFVENNQLLFHFTLGEYQYFNVFNLERVIIDGN